LPDGSLSGGDDEWNLEAGDASNIANAHYFPSEAARKMAKEEALVTSGFHLRSWAHKDATKIVVSEEASKGRRPEWKDDFYVD